MAFPRKSVVALIGAGAIAWLVPHFVFMLFCPACTLLPAALAAIVGRHTDRQPMFTDTWPMIIVTAVASLCLTTWIGNHIADRALDRAREALVAHHARTGEYPAVLDEPIPSVGLPGVQRSFTYAPSRVVPPQAPILFYHYAFPFGRRVIDVESGRQYTLD